MRKHGVVPRVGLVRSFVNIALESVELTDLRFDRVAKLDERLCLGAHPN